MNESFKCRSCDFFKDHEVKEGGLCYRYPPTPLHDSVYPESYSSVYPEVIASTIACGEYREFYNQEEVYFR